MRLLAAFLGLALGLGLGLYFAWEISPVQYTDTEPASLRIEDREAWIRLTAGAYAVEGDLSRARARLAALGEADSARAVTALAQRSAAGGADPATVQALAALAAALGAAPAPATPAAFTPAPPTATDALPAVAPPTATDAPPAVATLTPVFLPTQPASPTPPGQFQYVGLETVCLLSPAAPLLQVVALDAAGVGVPGVEVVVEWAGGQDRFFTGLKPELGEGYGDFATQPNLDYTVRLLSDPGAEYAVRSDPCTDSNGTLTATTVRLLFRQP